MTAEAGNPRPILSIITVVFNCELTLSSTIESVVQQKFKDFEYIIIDGGSTDGTLQLLEDYSEHIDIKISEKDKGIYDAMNKGIGQASGEWIYFLNAGDVLYDKRVLTNLFQLDFSADIVYGKHEADYGYFKRIQKPSALKKIWKGMIFSHQAMIAKTALMKASPFDLTYKMSADYNFIYKLYKVGAPLAVVDLIFCTVAAQGTSEINITTTHRERWRIARAYQAGFKKLNLDLYYCTFLFGLYVKKIAKFILPKSLIRKLTKRKYTK